MVCIMETVYTKKITVLKNPYLSSMVIACSCLALILSKLLSHSADLLSVLAVINREV
jgi:hypothetical protein